LRSEFFVLRAYRSANAQNLPIVDPHLPPAWQDTPSLPGRAVFSVYAIVRATNIQRRHH
jgi:hypothetical protein